MKKTVAILMLVTIVSKILGFVRDIVLSYFYGASSISDVYLISLTIPIVIFSFIGKGISVGFIPMYTRIESSDGTERANNYANNVINFVFLICTIIFIGGMIFTESIVKLFASGFKGETLELTVKFTKITLIGVYFSGLNYVFLAYLQIKGLFIIPTLMGLPANVIMVASIYASSREGSYTLLAVGSLIAIFSQFLLLFIFSYKSNYRYKPRLNFKDENIKKMAILALPAILGTSVIQINLLIDRTLASKIAPGGIAALNYASTLSVVIIGIFVLSISSVLYPKLSKLSAENNISELKTVLSGAISAVNILVLPAVVGCMIFARPIVEFLYGRGSFDHEALRMTSSALFYFSIGIVGLSHRETLANTFYSLQDTRTPMINAAIAMVLNIILNLILSKYLGIGGLALATSISTIFCTLLLLFNLRKRIGSLGLTKVSFSFIKILIASLAMGGLSKFIYHLLLNKFSLDVSLILSVAVGATVYFIIIFLLRIQEVQMIFKELKEKFRPIKETEAAK
ncbi:putative peptidoglycan lipid II flippase [Bacillus sp. SORGH_AS 510]|uniref:murein biosynthesis integral membrane protein MurJ n=1 Tax=Bacillus sp. SORGH_AS_0510 TaxID=3041771 RepID=UPI002788A8EC|nr:murein biosynthesis integral membrane protein MurJ [Bacillus sp. SORGH_AS_0510]MDQ1144590.1 putative peptidoglycan lipid II flippase [Bacillus sp. SORGH_AS_0510]